MTAEEKVKSIDRDESPGAECVWVCVGVGVGVCVRVCVCVCVCV